MNRSMIAGAMVVFVAVGSARGAGAGPVGPADDAAASLSAARDLYSAASYEDALSVLNKLRAGDHQGDEVRTIDQYRAFCLLALGRTSDAEQAIEAVVAADPFYQPADADVSPRVRTAFKDVRRRMLPSIVQDRYASAKAAYDRKAFPEAAAGFKQVLDVLSDPDVGTAASQPPLSDIRTLATGFRELSVAAAAPPPLPVVATAAIATPPPPRMPVVPQVYGPDDVTVMPPVKIRQDLPAFQFQTLVPPSAGSVEIVIDERGTVESATMRKPIFPRYDAQVIDATRSWQFRPALLNGAPVKYRKVVNITVQRQ